MMSGTLAEQNAAVTAPKRKTLWVVQQGEGDKGAQPLAFVLAGYGDAWVASGLARALGPEQTMFALQPGDDDKCGIRARELARRYVEHLLAAQPEGPYCVGGYSAGGVMALEMAIQLRAGGHEVAVVAPLDPLFMRYTRFEHLSYVALQRVCGVIEKVLPAKLRVLQILAAMFQDKGLDAHLAALAGHRTEHYSGEIALYQSSVALGRSPMLARQWKWFTGGQVRVKKMRGDHHTFIRPPHVHELARRLREDLRKNRA